MNEILHRGLKLSIPRIYQINMKPEQAYKLKTILDAYARDNKLTMKGALASHISHKMWLLTYKSKFSTAPSFTCLTGHWHKFCTELVQDRYQHNQDPDLIDIFTCLESGREIKPAT
jgi:hypothetical protein